ncbi:S1C family serine protease [Actinomycetospora cinnamomea]|uniref:S1-C subfamily serine protease n=1 Tax=Actinomycetospora cinnamomea TaxID=663609 RepID=A0A2U1F8P6_9PSEU|nr:trypsin-like peptidase domain-containing protein [Actinomycetospora cinnamomea]PVZ08565.1 S1-C subfamily serine protease [Actinomycetospora cinnamomea]
MTGPTDDRGEATNGHGTPARPSRNGHVATGQVAGGVPAHGGSANGAPTNGHEANGALTNGHETNGHETNGHETNGHGAGERELAAVFGRPAGVEGAFGGPPSDTVRHPPPVRREPPAPALVAAFGRPEGGAATSLQRPDRPADRRADRRADREDEPGDFWDGGTASADPWRDPDAAAELGGPALGEQRTRSSTPPVGPRLSARELILGRRVQPTALALLAVVALLLGAVGGVTGWAVAGGADSLVDPGATLTPVEPGRERPPGSVAEVAGRVAPAVVSLELQAGTSGGTGSGVVLSPDGYIVTNNHVVELAATDPRARLEAVFASRLRAPARVVGRDPQTDIAVVKVDLANPVVAQLGRSSALRVGDGVIAIGSPLGLAGTVTEGIVSSLDRPVRLDAESAEANPVIDAIQTDAAINPGNSGGALVDTSGAVVGINTAIRTLGGGEGGSIGLGFAIPIDDVRVIAESIIRTGGYTHSDLGVNAKSVTDGAADGAQVLNVRQGGPASRAGLLEGDVVLRVDDRPIASADELVVAVRDHRPGSVVTLGVVREGRPLALQVTL